MPSDKTWCVQSLRLRHMFLAGKKMRSEKGGRSSSSPACYLGFALGSCYRTAEGSLGEAIHINIPAGDWTDGDLDILLVYNFFLMAKANFGEWFGKVGSGVNIRLANA